MPTSIRTLSLLLVLATVVTAVPQAYARNHPSLSERAPAVIDSGAPAQTFADSLESTWHPLPLAQNASQMRRPTFNTIHFGLSFGVLFNDLAALEKLAGNQSGFSFPLSLLVDIPLSGSPVLSLVSGWGIDIGSFGSGSQTTFSVALLMRSRQVAGLPSFVGGLGVGHSIYSYSSSILIDASQSYLSLICGVTLAPNVLDILFSYPLAGAVTAEYDSMRYSVHLTGPMISLYLTP